MISYKYIKFCDNGRAVSIYTNYPPKKFVSKLGGRATDLMHLTAHGDPKKKEKFTQPALQFQLQDYEIYNDRVVLYQHQFGYAGAQGDYEHHRYEGRMHRLRQVATKETEDEVDEDQGYREYIEMDYFAEKMSEETFRWRNDLRPWDPLEPFHLPQFQETKNPFDVNYRWYRKSELTNRLPNKFVFQKLDEDLLRDMG